MDPAQGKLHEKENTPDRILEFLLILLTTVFTALVFIEREYHEADLICYTASAILFGMIFGRPREKRNWAFCLTGAILFGLWSFALIKLNPPIRTGQFFESLLESFKRINMHEYILIHKHVKPYRSSISETIIILLECIYLMAWIARFSSMRKRDILLRFNIFLTLPIALFPLSLTLIAPFLPEKNYQYAIFLYPALLTTVGISLILILTMLVLAVLKVRFGWKRLLFSYGLLILISGIGWSIFYGIQMVRRDLTLRHLAAEGRPMTLQEYYDRMQKTKNGMEQVSELIGFLKNPKFDTMDFPLNSCGDWLKKDIPESASKNYTWPPGGLKRSRKDAMIRISESPAGEKFTAGLAELAKYDHIRFNGNYTDYDPMLQMLTEMRWMVRTGAARAAIAHYTGKTEQILPRLKAVTPVSRLLDRQPWLICSMLHAAMDSIVVSQVIRLGPNAPEFADDYRFFLNWLRNQDYTPSRGETEIIAESLKYYDKDVAKINPLIRLLFRPLLLETRFYYLNRALRREKYFAACHNFPADDPIRENYLRLIISKGCNETALALKLYRSLHGKYPKSTTALVPEILPELPLDPVTGNPFRYKLKGNDFELFTEAFKWMWVASEPLY